MSPRKRIAVSAPPRGMQREALCQYLNVTPEHLSHLIERKALPPPMVIGDLEVWDRHRVDAQEIGFVYFIQTSGSKRIKIGYSKNPKSRLGDLQCSCPDELVVLALLRSHRDDESDLHARFEKYWVRGEWFEPGPELLSYIAEVARR